MLPFHPNAWAVWVFGQNAHNDRKAEALTISEDWPQTAMCILLPLSIKLVIALADFHQCYVVDAAVIQLWSP